MSSATPERTYDAIIIGSGFGGAITAHHLAGQGVRTALVERGPWRRTRPVLGAGITDTAPLPQGWHFYSHLLRNTHLTSRFKWSLPDLRTNRDGLYEIFYSNKTAVICASAVGGGSHAYTALHHRPGNPDYWQGVSEQIRPAEMEEHYKAFLDQMGSCFPPETADIPNQTKHLYANDPILTVKDSTWRPQMGVLFRESHHKPLPNRAFTRYENEGLLGSCSGSKTTVDVAYLLEAMEQGLVILDRSEALRIVKNTGNARKRYRVDVYDHSRRRYHNLEADYVFLGAGTLNTLKLLFRSRADNTLSGMNKLGKQFATNADAMALWLTNNPSADYTRGMPCHGPLDFHTNQAQADKAHFIQVGLSGFNDIPLPHALRKRLASLLLLIGMGEDENTGEARWQNNWLSLHYSVAEQAIYRYIHHRFSEVKQGHGNPVLFFRNLAATVHPLGGAPIHDDPSQGLIAGNGELHEHPGLFICDATALPRSPGMPPSMTIAAWARHVACTFIPSQESRKSTPSPLETISTGETES